MSKYGFNENEVVQTKVTLIDKDGFYKETDEIPSDSVFDLSKPSCYYFIQDTIKFPDTALQFGIQTTKAGGFSLFISENHLNVFDDIVANNLFNIEEERAFCLIYNKNYTLVDFTNINTLDDDNPSLILTDGVHVYVYCTYSYYITTEIDGEERNIPMVHIDTFEYNGEQNEYLKYIESIDHVYNDE